MAVNENDWLTRDEAAALLKYKPKTLANWAAKGQGPKFARVGGGRCRYRRADVLKWQEDQFREQAQV